MGGRKKECNRALLGVKEFEGVESRPRAMESEFLAMKTHKQYELRDNKEEERYHEKQELKLMAYTILMLILGALVVTCIFKLMEAGLGV